MPDRDESVEQRKVSPSLIAGIVIALAAIDFIAQNRQQITIHFLFFSFHWRIWVALTITGVLSIVAAELVGRTLRKKD